MPIEEVKNESLTNKDVLEVQELNQEEVEVEIEEIPQNEEPVTTELDSVDDFGKESVKDLAAEAANPSNHSEETVDIETIESEQKNSQPLHSFQPSMPVREIEQETLENIEVTEEVIQGTSPVVQSSAKLEDEAPPIPPHAIPVTPIEVTPTEVTKNHSLKSGLKPESNKTCPGKSSTNTHFL